MLFDELIHGIELRLELIELVLALLNFQIDPSNLEL